LTAYPNAAVFADIDRDGDVDLIVAGGASELGVYVEVLVGDGLGNNELLLGDGSGALVPADGFYDDDDLNPEAIHRSATAGDVDGDGNIDIVVSRRGGNGLLLGVGDGTFVDESQRLFGAADSTYAAALEDFDQDGDLDIVFANTVFNPFAQTLLINQGGAQGGDIGYFESGEFPPAVDGQSPIRLGLHTLDADHDGDIDLVFATHELGAAEAPDVYINQGGLQGGAPGSFARELDVPFLPGIYNVIASSDADGDGDLDILCPSAGQLSPEPGPGTSDFLTNGVFHAPNPPLAFRRGDTNDDLSVDISDAVSILAYLFAGGPAPLCLATADVDASAVLDISDAVSLLGHLFAGGTAPVAPFPNFGDDQRDVGAAARPARRRRDPAADDPCGPPAGHGSGQAGREVRSRRVLGGGSRREAADARAVPGSVPGRALPAR